MREEGYYWVKVDGDWHIARWYFPFSDRAEAEWDFWDMIRTDDFFEEIDENRIARGTNFPKLEAGQCATWNGDNWTLYTQSDE